VAHGKPLDAVIDKDHASALLAERIGADRLIVLTDVDAVYRDYLSSEEHVLTFLTPDEAEQTLADLPAGSMRPKVEACAAFVRAGGKEALITSARALEAALDARSGTRITAA
jgi:carbamate kinase